MRGGIMIPEGAIISGFISKIVNDFIDVTKDKIRKVLKQGYIR